MVDVQRNHLLKSFEQGVRFDDRGLDGYRDISVKYDVSKNAEGSAVVRIGDTEVIAGVKLTLGTPFPDRPEDGVIMVNAEFLPMASPDFESGPPSIDAIELARVVDRGIRESHAMDLKKLCIKKGEKVWIVSIDICTLNDDGNLLDASALAALAALKATRFPEYDGEEVNYKKHTDEKLPLNEDPIPVTVCKIGDYLFVDPCKDELDNIDARLTITVLADGNLCALQKGGETQLTIDEISTMVDLAIKKSKELRKKI
ncbi:MAG: exosome complex protein Rrp42 [Candidatus Woesearchaeota archaeon]